MKSGTALKKREFTLESGNVELTPSREKAEGRNREEDDRELTPSREKAEGRNREEDDRKMLIRRAAVPDKI